MPWPYDDDRLEEYDDGYGSTEDFERAECDTEETLREPDEEENDE